MMNLTQEAIGRAMVGPAPSTPSEEVLILTAATGAGHDTVAVALQEALRELAPQCHVRIVDAFDTKSRFGPMSLGRCYDLLVEYAPWLWRLLYRATNAEWAVRLGMAVGGPLWSHSMRAALRLERPRIVVSVHPLCSRLVASVLRDVPGAPSLHCVVTDLVTIHRCWASPGVDTFYVATREARDALTAMGVPAERVYVSGLPLRASFAKRQGCAVPDGGAPRVLLLGGGHPSRRFERVAQALAHSPEPVQLVAVCGRNERLRRRLTDALDGRATVLGWRDDVADLMRWSSVVVTKGGPTTVAEALSQARPAIVYQVLEDQETGNVALLERFGSDRYVPNLDALSQAVAKVPQDPFIGDATRAAWMRQAAHRVAERILMHTDLAARSQPADQPDETEDREICNPISGERIVIRQSGADTGGRLLSFDLFLPPGGHVPARHVHPGQEERFTVVRGRMRFRLGRRRTVFADPGDTVVVPPGTAHWFGNAGEGESHARVEVRPALRLQEVFERSAAMEVVERFPGARTPRLLDLALFMLEFQQELAVPDVPAFLVKTFLAPLAWLGRRRARHANRGSTA
jgi:1,2-diacylglycerol 3-beta-galactosyltransferase